jgi:hypothetical protein
LERNGVENEAVDQVKKGGNVDEEEKGAERLIIEK